MIRILYTDTAGIMQSIVLTDLEATHKMTVTTTDHPVELGADITDHARVELRPFSCRCLVSDSLLEAAESGMGSAVEASVSVPLADGTSVTMLGFSEQPKVVQNTYNALKDLLASRQPCTIVTNLDRYESMIIRDLAFPETTNDGIELTLEAREIRIVTTVNTTSPRPAQVRGHRRVNAGPQATTVVPAAAAPPPRATRETSTSAWAAITDRLGGGS
jgi:hypothetical protein